MQGVTIGNHAAVRVRSADRERIRSFYRDVLGCKITREVEGKDDVRIGDGFYIAFLYQSGDARAADKGVVHAAEDSLSEEQFLKSIWLEIKSADVEALRQRIVSFGVKVLPVPDDHLYFQAPGGQVFRLVGIDEDLSKYEGTTHN
jgi:catechol 2,3-dioxygenase-like lactoylglutathione lyase family enzyme